MKYSLCPYCYSWFETSYCSLHLSRCPSFPVNDDTKAHTITIADLKRRTQHLGGVLQTDDENNTKKSD